MVSPVSARAWSTLTTRNVDRPCFCRQGVGDIEDGQSACNLAIGGSRGNLVVRPLFKWDGPFSEPLPAFRSEVG